MPDRPDVFPTLDLAHPRVFHDRTGLGRARANAAPDGPDWAHEIRENVIEAAESTPLLGRDPTTVRETVPDSGAHVLQESGRIINGGVRMAALFVPPGT